jgi:hypothetical protein
MDFEVVYQSVRTDDPNDRFEKPHWRAENAHVTLVADYPAALVGLAAIWRHFGDRRSELDWDLMDEISENGVIRPKDRSRENE